MTTVTCPHCHRAFVRDAPRAEESYVVRMMRDEDAVAAAYAYAREAVEVGDGWASGSDGVLSRPLLAEFPGGSTPAYMQIVACDGVYVVTEPPRYGDPTVVHAVATTIADAKVRCHDIVTRVMGRAWADARPTSPSSTNSKPSSAPETPRSKRRGG